MKDQYEDDLLIPKERVAVLIGPKGQTRKQIEYTGKIKLQINAKEGEVKIISNDAVSLWLGKKVVEAIGRGFNPEIAQKIFKEGNSFELINLRDYASKSKKDLERLKSRIIGTKGKTKRTIQKHTSTDISIYGKTIGVIGSAEGVQLACRAIEMILTGAKQTTAYRFLETSLGKKGKSKK